MEKQRDIAWDYARGIAIMMIVIYHIYGYCDRSKGSVANSCFHTMQIPIFMYVSGFFTRISLLKTEGGTFIAKRVKRLLFPFFSFMVVWLLISPHEFVQEIVLDDFKGGYWYMLVLFEMMALLATVLFIARKTSQPFLLVLISKYFFTFTQIQSSHIIINAIFLILRSS